jgi:23S rRNA (uracil1939-C5)-methyltransferase
VNRYSVKWGDEIEITVERFALEGKSVARVDGLVVFVAGGVPGDRVRARVTKSKKKFVEAEVVDILTQSPFRVRPRCKYFGTCGGCKWQHVGYAAQLDFKRQHVIDALERIGGFDDVVVNPTLGSREEFFYRNKMEFSFGDKWLTKEELEARYRKQETQNRPPTFALGLHIPQRFDKVLDIGECYLQSETSYKIVNTLREFCMGRGLSIYSTFTHTGYLRNLVIRESRRTGELMVNLVTSEDNAGVMRSLCNVLLAHFPTITTIVNNITERKSQVAIGDYEKVYHGSGFITERIGQRTYKISANSFFQTNSLQAERLYEIVARLAELKSDDIVFDLYSGTGTIALYMADLVREVVGIEIVESAIDDSRENALMNQVTNCRFVLGDLKDKLTKDTSWLSNHAKPTIMVIDPPRSGMHEKVVLEIATLQPERIVYVSCNPATQARDLKLLCSKAPYRIRDVQPVDMFPHTYHTENVVALSTIPQH